MIRIVGQPELHRPGTPEADPRVSRTPCGIRHVAEEWPRRLARPPLPRCPVCFGRG